MTTQEIKARLKQKRVSQATLARRWGKSKVTVHYLVEGKLKSYALEKKLARVLGVSVQVLNGRAEKDHGAASLE